MTPDLSANSDEVRDGKVQSKVIPECNDVNNTNSHHYRRHMYCSCRAGRLGNVDFQLIFDLGAGGAVPLVKNVSEHERCTTPSLLDMLDNMLDMLDNICLTCVTYSIYIPVCC